MRTTKDGFPLSLHKATGQWCKRVRGKVHYFGTDKDAAAKRWYAERDAIYAGEDPRAKTDEPTVKELGNVFIEAKRKLNAETGKPSARHIALCEGTIGRLLEFVGKDCRVSKLSPDDFASIKSRFFEPVPRKKPVRGKVFGRQVKRRAPGTVAGDVRRVRVFLNWCYDAEKIATKPRYGKQFEIETEVAITKQSLRQQKEKARHFSAEELRALIDAATVQYKPLLLLAINSGLGNSDIAAIEWDDVEKLDAAECWVDLPRLKTGVARRFVLWEETRQAIRNYLPKRERHTGQQYANFVFLTRCGRPWVRPGDRPGVHVDSIVTSFAKLRDKAGLSHGTFYDIRRSFATVAHETLDFPAVKQLMGHKPRRDMTEHYVQDISDARIKAVCEQVRNWLFGA